MDYISAAERNACRTKKGVQEEYKALSDKVQVPAFVGTIDVEPVNENVRKHTPPYDRDSNIIPKRIQCSLDTLNTDTGVDTPNV